MKARLLLVLLAALPLVPLQALAQAPVEHHFLARVSVDAEGRVTDTELMKPVAEPLRTLVLDTAAGIAFEPATRGGVAVPSRTALNLGMRFIPQGKDLQVELVSVGGGDRHAGSVRDALLEAMAEWRFLVEEVDGVAIGTRFPVPVTFCSAKRGAAGGSAQVCADWRRAVRAEFERPTPADPGIRLAQLRTPVPNPVQAP